MTDETLLEIDGLSAHYAIRSGVFARPSAFVRAVDDVSLRISRGETLGLVGESGCGKTTLGRTILALRPPTAGSVRFNGQSIFDLKPPALKRLRRDMQIVFQDPYAALDPRRTVGRAVRVPLDVHGIGQPKDRPAMVAALFREVGLEPNLMDRFPHEFSGGQRQRVVIARAIATRPKLLVCDEPVSALDVSIQAQILNLLKDLQAGLSLTTLFISHNLAVVEHMADRVAVMYLRPHRRNRRSHHALPQPAPPLHTRALRLHSLPRSRAPAHRPAAARRAARPRAPPLRLPLPHPLPPRYAPLRGGRTPARSPRPEPRRRLLGRLRKTRGSAPWTPAKGGALGTLPFWPPPRAGWALRGTRKAQPALGGHQ